MHIPDNYLSPLTCAVFGAGMIPVWKMAAGSVRKNLSRKKMPLLGVGAAFSFLTMMFNVPLPGGTTGHAVGASIAAILWGPEFAVIAVTIALAIQALFFGDGGILAFGVNCFNMAFIMPYSASFLFRLLAARFPTERGRTTAAFLAGYASINLAAFLAAVEFGVQPLLFKDSSGMPLYSPYGLGVSIPAMMIPHLLVAGVIEGIVTAGVYRYIRKAAPEIAHEAAAGGIRRLYAVLGVLAFLTPLGLLAAGIAWGEWSPDELKESLGYIPKGMRSGFEFIPPMPGYGLSGVPGAVGYILSALIGMLLIWLLVKVCGRFVPLRNKRMKP